MAVTAPDRPTLQQAFASARAEHSEPPAKAPSEHAPPPDTASPGEPTADQPPAKPTAPASPSSPTRADVDLTDLTNLISDEEYQALATTHKDDPVALRKALLGVWTKKTQGLSELKKTIEPYADLISDFEEDPEKTLGVLAAQYGKRLTPFEGEPAKPATETVVDTAVAKFRTALGDEYGFLADALAPAVKALAEDVAKGIVSEQVAPLKSAQEGLVSRAAREQTATIMQTFTAKHPTWQQHEAEMMRIGARLQPKGMEELEYLETLFHLATKDRAVSTGVQKVVERMVTDAEQAEGAERPTSESRVKVTSPKRPTFHEAAEAARRGVRFED